MRQTPYSVENEQNLLGSIIFQPINLDKVSDKLSAEHFYNPIHAAIYNAIIKLQQNSREISGNNIIGFLRDLEMPEGITIMGYIAQLVANATVIISVSSLADEIYEDAMRRQLLTIYDEGSNDVCSPSKEKSSKVLIEEMEQNLFKLVMNGKVESRQLGFMEGLTKVFQSIVEAKKRGKSIVGIPTGYIDLDKILNGLRESNLIILAARPAMGKTSLAINIAYNVAENFLKEHIANPESKKKSVGVFSLEMSGEEIINRVISFKTGINGFRLANGDCSSTEFIEMSRMIGNINQCGIHIDDTPGMTISALRTAARRMKINNNISLLIVDYLQMLYPNKQSANRNNDIGEISRGLKEIAKELKIPVIALSQLSRKVEDRPDKKPFLSDLRDSGNIEQDADVVMFLYREEYYLFNKRSSDINALDNVYQEMKDCEGKAEVIIAKHRSGGVGSVMLQFDKETTGFNNLDYMGI